MNRVSWFLCLFTSTLSVALSYHLSVYSQVMSKAFITGGMALPKVTIFYLEMTESLLNNIASIFASLLVVKEFVLENPGTRFKVNILAMFLVLLFFGFGYWAMMVPKDVSFN